MNDHNNQLDLPLKPSTGQKQSPDPDNIPWPGRVKWDNLAGTHSGCRAITFNGTAELNLFAEAHPEYIFTYFALAATGTILALYTTTLTDDQIFVLTERAKIIDEELDKRRAERKAAVVSNDLAVLEEKKILRELAEEGLHCRQNHKKVAKKKDPA